MKEGMHPLAWIKKLADFIFPPRADELLVRDANAAALARLVSPELIETTRPPTTALCSFSDDLVRALVREAKYRGSARAQELLGRILAEYFLELSTDTYEKAVIVPIPLSPARRRERGYNQCEEVAKRALAYYPELPLTIDAGVLRRVRNTEHQTRLSRSARAANVEGAFEATRPLDTHTTYIVFDDVITTGATLQAAARALRAAGAKRILPIALAR